MNNRELQTALRAAEQTELEEAKARKELRTSISSTDEHERALITLLAVLYGGLVELYTSTLQTYGVDLRPFQTTNTEQSRKNYKRLPPKKQQVVDENIVSHILFFSLWKYGVERADTMPPEVLTLEIVKELELAPKYLNQILFQCEFVPDHLLEKATLYLTGIASRLMKIRVNPRTQGLMYAHLQEHLDIAGKEGLYRAVVEALAEHMEPEKTFAYVNRTAKNLRREYGEDVRRNRVRDADGENLMNELPDTSAVANVEEAFTRKEEYAEAVKQWQTLKPIYRNALWLDWQGLTVEESAQQQGVKFETAKKRLHRAEQKLKNLQKKD